MKRFVSLFAVDDRQSWPRWQPRWLVPSSRGTGSGCSSSSRSETAKRHQNGLLGVSPNDSSSNFASINDWSEVAPTVCNR